MQQPDTLGARFARALAAKDRSGILEVLHPEIDFRGMTPNRTWDAGDPDEVIAILVGNWFGEADDIRALDRLETDTFSDRERVGYRFSVGNPDGDFVIEQQAYLAVRDGRIGWMRVLCSGYRPAASSE